MELTNQFHTTGGTTQLGIELHAHIGMVLSLILQNV